MYVFTLILSALVYLSSVECLVVGCGRGCEALSRCLWFSDNHNPSVPKFIRLYDAAVPVFLTQMRPVAETKPAGKEAKSAEEAKPAHEAAAKPAEEAKPAHEEPGEAAAETQPAAEQSKPVRRVLIASMAAAFQIFSYAETAGLRIQALASHNSRFLDCCFVLLAPGEDVSSEHVVYQIVFHFSHSDTRPYQDQVSFHRSIISFCSPSKELKLDKHGHLLVGGVLDPYLEEMWERELAKDPNADPKKRKRHVMNGRVLFQWQKERGERKMGGRVKFFFSGKTLYRT